MAASYTFEDLSGTVAPGTSDNPYDGLIDSCQNDPAQIQKRYETHRETRASQQRAKLLSPEFSAVTIDEILLRLETEPEYQDPRNCLVFWARPPTAVKDLIKDVQTRLQRVLPKLWLMPYPNLHMTALEITHSLTEPEISEFVRQLQPVAKKIVDLPFGHRARLVKPKITYDAQAMALSFVPASNEGLVTGRTSDDDKYSYHHLRRDVYALSREAGVDVASRYVVPSAHLTIGRFIHQAEFQKADGSFDHSKMRQLIDVIDATNEWLEREYWPNAAGTIRPGGEWIVGQEKGLDHRRGRLWYGGGETLALGKGF